MANANFFSPDGGITRYPLEDTEGRIMYEEEVHGINLLKLEYPYQSRTIQNITYTVDNDGIITVNGTTSVAHNYPITQDASGNVSSYKISEYPFIKDGNIISAGIPSDSSIDMLLAYRTSESVFISEQRFKDKVVISIPSNAAEFQIKTETRAGSYSNLKIKPMIIDAKYDGIPFTPYNQQSIQHQLDSVYENGAVNRLDNKTTNITISGITFTVDDNKIIYANGTSANSGVTPQIAMHVSLPKGRWVYSGCPDGGSEQKWDMILWDETTSSRLVGGALFNSNDRLEFEITDANVNHNINAYARVQKGGVVCNNIAFKPMIALPSYTGPYVPYAMTNRELTEATEVEDITSEFTFASDIAFSNNWSKILKNGKLISVCLRFTTPSTVTQDKAIITVPDKYKPFFNYIGLCTLNKVWSGETVGLLTYLNSGSYCITGTTWPASTEVLCNFSYLIP